MSALYVAAVLVAWLVLSAVVAVVFGRVCRVGDECRRREVVGRPIGGYRR